MTTSTVRIMHCDFAGCDARAPKPDGEGYVKDRPDGWTDVIYTHGCPDHGDVIKAHRADITSDSRGRGMREKTTWYLKCACGWRPARGFQTYNTDRLKVDHLAHVAAVTAEAEKATAGR